MGKGMSQFWLSFWGQRFFTMAGVSLMYIFTGAVGDSQSSVDVTKCRQSINGLCATTGSGDVPPTCTNEDGEVPSEVSNQLGGRISGGQISCS
jgi:hypothetical protein